MSLPSRHIRTIGCVLVLLFFLANSGFTVVLRHCTMGVMECCSGSDGQTAGSCCMTHPLQTHKDHAITGGNTCHSVELAGGLKTDPTLVENRPVAHVAKLDMTGILTLNFASSDDPALFPIVLATGSHNASTPSVETHILNSTFLI